MFFISCASKVAGQSSVDNIKPEGRGVVEGEYSSMLKILVVIYNKLIEIT